MKIATPEMMSWSRPWNRAKANVLQLAKRCTKTLLVKWLFWIHTIR